jgi:predicted membrane-bound spermidine synthase
MIRTAALVLTIVTGFTGLVYEVAWQKYLATLLGSHGAATSAVLAIFLGGLSIGYGLFGRITRWTTGRAQDRARPARLLYHYALIEAGIGLHALLFPWLFGAAQAVSLWAPGGEGLRFAFDVALAGFLIGPPAILMGGTIPYLTLALSRDVEESTRVHAQVYGFNALGAFAGALAGGFWLIPRLGLDNVVLAMGCTNLLVAAVFAQLDSRAQGYVRAPEAPAHSPASWRAWALVSLLIGFAMMALQTTLNRMGALALGSSQYTFSMIVAIFVLCIAIGSLAVSTAPRVPRWLLVAAQWLLVLALFPLYQFLGDSPYAAHVLRVLFRDVTPAFEVYRGVVLVALLLVLAIPVGLSGALLPLIFHELRRDRAGLGAVAGRIYAWNTAGSLMGALLGGYLLLIWLDLDQIYRLGLVALALGAALSTSLVYPERLRLAPLLLLAPVAASIGAMSDWRHERLAAGLFRERAPRAYSFAGADAAFGSRDIGEVIFYDDDPTSSVAVVSNRKRPELLGILVNGKSDGSIVADYPTMAMSGLLPALMADRHESAFVVGWGTGVTAGELAALDETRSVRVAEISRGVIGAAPLFDDGNLAASQSPKVALELTDAYRALLRTGDRFDVIVSEPSNPWVTGVEMLYSREFLAAARDRLAPGGVYAQWFHLYESDEEVVSLVLRTYAQVFEHVSVWYALGSDLLLLGFDGKERALDLEALAARFARDDFSAGFARAGIESFPQLLAHELLPIGTIHGGGPPPGDVHTLRRPILSDRAARAFYTGRYASLPVFASEIQQGISLHNSLLRRLGGRGPLSEELLEAAALEACRAERREDCASWFGLWGASHPGSERLERALEAQRELGGNRVPQLSGASLSRIRMLHNRRALDSREPIPIDRAERITRVFLQHYHHAAPFDRRIFEALWERCDDPRCEKRRALHGPRLGGMAVSEDVPTLLED